MGCSIQRTERKRLLTNKSVSSKSGFRIGGMKLFPEKQRCKEFVASRSDLQEELKGVLQADGSSDRHKEIKSTAEKNCVGKLKKTA